MVRPCVRDDFVCGKLCHRVLGPTVLGLFGVPGVNLVRCVVI